jgi:curved DNA-binding protein CbpA
MTDEEKETKKEARKLEKLKRDVLTARAILGVHERASVLDIKVAYRKKSLETHPDRGGSTEEFKRVNWANERINLLLKIEMRERQRAQKQADKHQPEPQAEQAKDTTVEPEAAADTKVKTEGMGIGPIARPTAEAPGFLTQALGQSTQGAITPATQVTPSSELPKPTQFDLESTPTPTIAAPTGGASATAQQTLGSGPRASETPDAQPSAAPAGKTAEPQDKGKVNLDALFSHFEKKAEAKIATDSRRKMISDVLGKAFSQGSQQFAHSAIGSIAGKIGGPAGSFVSGFGSSLVHQMFHGAGFGDAASGEGGGSSGGGNSELRQAIVELTEAVKDLSEKLDKQKEGDAPHTTVLGKAAATKAAGAPTTAADSTGKSDSVDWMKTLMEGIKIARDVAAAMG